MKIQQIRSKDGTGTLSYLLSDGSVGLLIDPNRSDLAEIRRLVKEAGVRVTHIVDTHTHVDHVSAAGEFGTSFEAEVVMHEKTKDKWKVVEQGDRFGIGETLRANAAITIDRHVRDGDTITTGGINVTLLHTPGHTDNHLTVVAGENLFTGDLLLIGQAGRSDLPGGDPGEQYDSLFNKILKFPDHARIYPGHDYADNEYALLSDEKKTNPFLQPRTKDEYRAFVEEFFPPLAEATANGGAVTLQCGATRVIQETEHISMITSEDLAGFLKEQPDVLVLDVREPAELVATGHIRGAVNIPVGLLPKELNNLRAGKDSDIVCVCQSGGRSLEAAHLLQSRGFTRVKNLVGGTAGWILSGHPVVRPTGQKVAGQHR
ncbi:MAG: MBL fold metallo-hydrolase [Ignavibacteria bacterium]|nr:MBL fold metallo-hydrolase [Ignavibacteria bacterium]